MANVSAATVFEGFDDAEVDDRYPKLPAMGRYEVEVTANKLVDGRNGITFVCEHKIVSSSRPEVPEGATYSTTITDIKGRHTKMKMGQVKSMLAAMFGVDPRSEQKWQQLIVYVCDKNAAAGKHFVIETGPEEKAKESGKNYIPKVYSPLSE